MIILAAMLLLHAPGGAEVWVNPQQVTSLHERQDSEHFTKHAACLIGLTDGKFVTVVEPCNVVRDLMEDKK